MKSLLKKKRIGAIIILFASTPGTIYNGVYFDSNPGTFYMEYTAWDGTSSYYMYYTLESNPGFLMLPGDDIWYEIALYSSGPTLYQWDYEYDLAGSEFLAEKTAAPADSVPDVSNNLDPISGTRGPELGTQTREYDWGTITITYGRILN